MFGGEYKIFEYNVEILVDNVTLLGEELYENLSFN